MKDKLLRGPGRYLSTADAAAILGCTRQALNYLIRKKRLKVAVQAGRVSLIDPADLKKIHRLRTGEKPGPKKAVAV